MTIEEIYQAEQELVRYNAIMSHKEILTQEEYDFCKSWDAEEAWKYLNDLGDGRYLNINVYSEADRHQFRRTTTPHSCLKALKQLWLQIR
jgi:hypothetical protein